MKKTILVYLAAVLFLAGFTINGFAAPIHTKDFSNLIEVEYNGHPYDYTGATTSALNAGLGQYIGTGTQTVFGNVGDDTVTQIFINQGFTSTVMASVNVYGVGNEENEIKSGWWSTVAAPAVGDFIDFIVVKGATSFSIHQYIPSKQEGLWDVGRLVANPSGKPPAMSFVRAYTTGTPVPEPATLLLLGLQQFPLQSKRTLLPVAGG